jgi:hypothetical protein
MNVLVLGLSVGTIMWVELRLLGHVTKHYRVSDVVGRLGPWFRCDVRERASVIYF